MCETSATPLHSDGLLGDAINFLLSGSYEATTSHDREYSEAQAQGQVSSGDVNKISINIYFFPFIYCSSLATVLLITISVLCLSSNILRYLRTDLNKHKMLLYVVLIVISFQYVNIEYLASLVYMGKSLLNDQLL